VPCGSPARCGRTRPPVRSSRSCATAAPGTPLPTTTTPGSQSLTDPRELISIGFVATGPGELKQWLSTAQAPEAARHERIDTVIESTTTLRSMYELRTEHDFSHLPQQIGIGSPASLLAALTTA
jgi:hypothetical protein